MESDRHTPEGHLKMSGAPELNFPPLLLFLKENDLNVGRQTLESIVFLSEVTWRPVTWRQVKNYLSENEDEYELHIERKSFGLKGALQSHRVVPVVADWTLKTLDPQKLAAHQSSINT